MRAFAELVGKYQGPVVHFCQRMVGSLQDAEDLAQETFLRVYRYLPRMKAHAKFSTFLFTVARNLSLNAVRDSRTRRAATVSAETDVATTAPGPASLAHASETEGFIEQALARLSPDHREVLLLREINDMDYGEIARVLGCRIGTVRSRLARAREQLRMHMTALTGDGL